MKVIIGRISADSLQGLFLIYFLSLKGTPLIHSESKSDESACHSLCVCQMC